MSFTESIRSGFRKYATFEGVAPWLNTGGSCSSPLSATSH